MPTVKDTAKLLALKREIEQLSPADRLRFAALCLERGEYAIAETLVHTIANELSAVRLLRGRRE